MALSMKNTFVSLSLSGLMLVAGFLAGEQPTVVQASISGAHTLQSAQQNKTVLQSTMQPKKTKRAFTTPYFSFGKSTLPTGVR